MVPVSLRDYFCRCCRANTSVRPYGICGITLLCLFVRTISAPCSSVKLVCLPNNCFLWCVGAHRCVRPNYSNFLILGVVIGYSLTVPVTLRDYFCGCYRANTSVRPYGRYHISIRIFCAHILCVVFFCLINILGIKTLPLDETRGSGL